MDTTAAATHSEPAILYLDDDRPNLEVFRRWFDDDFRVITVSSPREALALISNDEIGVLVSDQRMPEMSGIEFLVAAADRNPHATRMLLTAYSDQELLLDAINRGHVHDYVLKVWDMKDMGLRLRNGLEAYLRRIAAARAENEAELLREELAARDGDGTVIGLERGLRGVAAAIARLAGREQAILLRGERGSGRRTIAREIHRRTRRVHGPFVRLACAAGDAHDLDELLFGSGNDDGPPRMGRLERAHSGILYLDDIGALPRTTQDRLEAALENRRLEWTGSRRAVQLDVRIIASATTDLAGAAADGRFNRALYERLAEGTIVIPPLRDRREDIAPLAQAIVERLGRQCGSRIRLTPSAVMALTRFFWPGNVQELVLVLERAALHATELDVETLGLAHAEHGATP